MSGGMGGRRFKRHGQTIRAIELPCLFLIGQRRCGRTCDRRGWRRLRDRKEKIISPLEVLKFCIIVISNAHKIVLIRHK